SKCTPLIWASRNGHLDIVKELLAHNAFVNSPDVAGCTPLDDAAYNGYLNIAKELLAHGASVNTSNMATLG
ncbi:unnamed protein product, partial [Aphanomyces euteiches]